MTIRLKRFKKGLEVFQFDLDTVNFGKVSSGKFSITLRASGTLFLHDTRNRVSETTLLTLTQAIFSMPAKRSANTAAGQLVGDTTLKFDPKTNTVSFSNSLTTRSNLPDHPIISLTAGTNAQGQPALIGKMTQDAVKGTFGSHTFAGEKITIEIEITAEAGIEEQVTAPALASKTAELPTVEPVVATRQPPQSGVQTSDVVDGVFIVLGTVKTMILITRPYLLRTGIGPLIVRTGIGVIALVFIFGNSDWWLERYGQTMNARLSHYAVAVNEILYRWFWLERDLAQLKEDYGVTVHADLALADYSTHWLDEDGQPDIGTKIVATTNRDDFARFVRIIKPEIERYAPALIRQHLTDLYGFDDLVPGGVEMAGTYELTQNRIYMTHKYGKPLQRRPDVDIKVTLHHEFSSILMHRHDFNEGTWRQAAGPDFRYEQDNDLTYEWLYLRGHIDEIAPLEVLLARGLLNAYSETGVENDFNTYAGVIFTQPETMRGWIAHYPIVARKYALFKAFYLGIDAGLAPVFAAIDGEQSVGETVLTEPEPSGLLKD